LNLPEKIQRKIDEWKLKIDFMLAFFGYYGSFSPIEDEIRLATKEHQVIFHELVHAALAKIEKFENGQKPEQEIIAEFAAMVLMSFFKLKINKSFGYKYIEYHSKLKGKNVVDSCCELIGKVGRILNVLLG